MSEIEKKQYVRELAKKKNAVILVHYYVRDEVQEVADFLGDSLYLAQQAQKQKDADIILFAGVNFMAETAKILNPSKIVITPDNKAGCTLADCADPVEIMQWKKNFKNPYLISYINCSTEIKTLSDVICTSSNVLKVVKNAPKDATLLFAPDINLGSWVNKTLNLNMQLWNGNCVVHHNYSEVALNKEIELYPTAKIVAHPECPMQLLNYADFVGSTTAIMNFIAKNEGEFIVLTELGVKRQILIDNPDKILHFIPSKFKEGDNFCVNMKKHNIDKVIAALENLEPRIELDENIRLAALKPLELMLEISGK